MLLSALFKKGISHSHKIGFLQSTVKFVDQRRASSWKLRQNRKDQKIECRVVKKKCIWKMANPSLRVRPSTYAIHQCTPNGVIHCSSSYFSTTYSILPQWLKIHPQKSHFFGQNINFRCKKEIHLHSGQKFYFLCHAQFCVFTRISKASFIQSSRFGHLFCSPQKMWLLCLSNRCPNSKCCI